MSRTDIIRIGIDLGTTNSAISINENNKSLIIENNKGDLYVPSVFGFDKRSNPVVGSYAYDQLFKFSRGDDYKNYIAEVKRLMGTDEKIYFPIVDRNMNPEEISAEILKELKSELLKKYPNISTIGVVITVPAFFDTVQSEATKRAGALAGFDHVVLVQEPIAAAMSYEFGNTNNENWLVYDLGGGTFDVALISSKDRVLRVVEHSGDNHLGGKDIDELIVQKIIVPEILKKHKISNFNNSNPNFHSHFLRLKKIAESAKIKLSSDEKVYIDSDEVNLNLLDDAGNEVYFSFPFTVNEFNNLITPIIDKTLVKVQEVIDKSGMKHTEISKVIFVGATTKIPYIKEKVERTLKIPVDVSVNPFTIVAEGAGVFALSQQIPRDKIIKNEPLDDDIVEITLNYDSMTNEEYELITGSINLMDNDKYHLQVNSKNGFFNSERIQIKDNKFYLTVALEENKNNEFWIYLIDDLGNSVNIYPDNFSIVHGMLVTGVPIPHTIGVIYHEQDGNGDWKLTGEPYFNKNSILPLTETKTFKTINKVNKGTNEILPIVVYEGDYKDYSLNQEITRIGIDGKKIPLSLSAGEEIDITITINESRELEVEAYIPVLDIALNARVDVHSNIIDKSDLINTIDQIDEDVNELKDLVTDEKREDLKTRTEDLKSQLKSSDDSDTKQRIDRELKNLKSELTNITESTNFERLKLSYNEKYKNIEDKLHNIMNKEKEEEFIKEFDVIKNKSKSIFDNKDENQLKSLIKDMELLESNMRLEDPMFWIGLYHYINQNVSSFTNNAEAERIKSSILDNAEKGQFNQLRDNISRLMSLVPKEESDKVSKVISGITK